MTTIKLTPSPMSVNITAIAGDTLDNWSITFTDAAGDPYDISALDFYYVVKSSYDVADTEAYVSKAPGDLPKTDSGSGTTDTVTLDLTADEMEITTGDHVHALKVKQAGYERTWMEGTFSVKTRRITTV